VLKGLQIRLWLHPRNGVFTYSSDPDQTDKGTEEKTTLIRQERGIGKCPEQEQLLEEQGRVQSSQ